LSSISIEVPIEVLRKMLGTPPVENALVVMFRMTCPDWVGEVCDCHGALIHDFSEEVTKAHMFYKK
jgi:hypothetical protein